MHFFASKHSTNFATEATCVPFTSSERTKLQENTPRLYPKTATAMNDIAVRACLK
ncbi:hypothetical protein SNOG_10027 [Parastagonospora nodorum SN15]|uniref:Uncharacterized protein n=1 Tax=Phaeosphaeria nodorum (strain SN15 / ATCC MYA-4574 / FGSC 10173) TaxID=321614 RepID=Q0UDY7_PHANO|nr:hypothetical protein SNOG_10027 [Parastagonospora nodorum SN15]EAT82362.1 hypothetical protein SNOG_10027 [Parastagonospora nodorum SN15]